MYLKSLVLKGFKSFVDRSVLSLEPGITVIVGPNGSGKSNISDAILWVLGEQSAKQLRGQVMEDVIFSGTSARSAVGVAEVDLVLDNSDGLLPLDFTEVAITRRMYRNGDSDYLINGSPARLRDILDILHDSGIGRDTHSIISQGSLANVLESRPEDRRALIEEAAGILKHKKRKERAGRKLAAMDASLTRVQDVAKEIERSLRPLERQAARAQEYTGLADELKDLELRLAVDDLRGLQSQWDEVSKRDREADAEIEVLRLRYQDRENELEKLQSALEKQGLYVGDLATMRGRCQTVMSTLESSMLLLEEKGKNMVERTSDLRGVIHKTGRELSQAQAEYTQLSREFEEASALYAARTKELAELNRESEQIRKSRLESDEAYNALNTDLRAKQRAIDESQLTLTRSQQSIENNSVEDGLLQNRFAQIDEQFSTMQGTLAAQRSKLEEIEEALDKNNRESELAKLDIDKRVRLLDTARTELDKKREAHAQIRAEIKGLEEVDRAFDSASPALSWVLSHAEEFQGGMRPISDMFTVPEEFEKVTERLLGADLFGLVVDDIESAELVANSLASREGGEGEISLLPLSGSKSLTSRRSRVGVRLLDYLEYEATVSAAAEALFGDVYVVNDIAEALEAVKSDETGSRYVTRSGALIWPNGKITLGTQSNDVEGVLARKRKLEALNEGLEKTTAQLSESELAVADAEETLKAAQQDDFELSSAKASLQGECDSMRTEVGRLEQSLTAMTAERDTIVSQREAVAAKSAKAEPLLEELKTKIAALGDECKEIEEKIAAGANERISRADAESEVRERLSSCKVDIQGAQTSSNFLRKRIASLEEQIRACRETIETSKETQASLDVLGRRVDPLYQVFEALGEGIKQKAKDLQDQAKLEETDSSSLRETITGARDAVHTAKEELDAKVESVQDVRIAKGKIETQVEAAIKSIVEDNGVILEVALECEPLEDRTTAEDRAIKLRRKISSIGPVNQVAAEEYESLKRRRDFIAEQVDDLEGARKALNKIVATIDRKMRNQFLETFEVVDANFQEIFSNLFPGGSAHLILTDPDNPETTGIEVSAQPRGKRITKMTLMSGGERSLTALALLFAVYRTRTVPFYVLDEVEAALDDTNLRRMIAYLDSMRHETQFIMISHQRRTMEMADVLYGVSMQADGVSKVVSQKLERAIAENAEDATPEDVQRAIDAGTENVHPVGAPHNMTSAHHGSGRG